MFNNKRLSLARLRRRQTAKGLAEEAGISALTITRLEKGENQPDEETLSKIAGALRYPVEFFYGEDPEDLDTGAVSFRGLTKMTAKERGAALSAGSLGLALNDWVEERFSLPEPNLLDLGYETEIETAARSLRQFWGLGLKPIGSMIKLLETQGVRVLSLAENTSSVNAFSFWRGGVPFVFLNNFKTAENGVFDAAHELGHLVLHAHGGVGTSREIEREANAFASSFLMPADDVRARMPRLIKVDTILLAKKRWRVSAMAMAYRCHKLKLLSDWQYKSICIELGRRGYRSGEPDGIARDESAVWKKILSQLWAEKTTKQEIAEQLDLPIDEIEGLVWGLSGKMVVPPERSREATKLSVV